MTDLRWGTTEHKHSATRQIGVRPPAPDAHPEENDLYRNSDVPLDTVPPDSSNRQSESHKKPTIRKAAVLIPLLKQQGIWHVMYIRRTVNQHDRHSGQVAFPGGAQEPGDKTAVQTALRETREEIGITEDNVKILGSLTPYQTVSYFHVTPVVGLVSWPCTMRLQNSEVARAFTIPLNWLRDDHNFELREREATSASDTRERRYPVVHYKEYDGERLWGASARMTLNFLKVIKEQELLLPG